MHQSKTLRLFFSSYFCVSNIIFLLAWTWALQEYEAKRVRASVEVLPGLLLIRQLYKGGFEEILIRHLKSEEVSSPFFLKFSNAFGNGTLNVFIIFFKSHVYCLQSHGPTSSDCTLLWEPVLICVNVGEWMA